MISTCFNTFGILPVKQVQSISSNQIYSYCTFRQRNTYIGLQSGCDWGVCFTLCHSKRNILTNRNWQQLFMASGLIRDRLRKIAKPLTVQSNTSICSPLASKYQRKRIQKVATIMQIVFYYRIVSVLQLFVLLH